MTDLVRLNYIAVFDGMLSLPIGAKIIPGGPFVSLFGDVLPSMGGLIGIWCSLR